MKRKLPVVGYFLLLMIFASAISCASSRNQESAGEYVDNSVITAKVKAAFAGDDIVKAYQIGVVTFKDTVQLSGFVDSHEVVEKAGQIAGSVKGVTNVQNNLIVK